MSKQTAVEWLRHQLIENIVCRDPAKGISIMYFHDNAFLDLCGQAKQMEKEQIIQSWHNGYNNQSPMIDEENCGNTYYQQNYGGDNE